VRLAFLAPDLQRAILAGEQPSGLNLEQLIHNPIPVSWAEQAALFDTLGLSGETAESLSPINQAV
jgi:site-specific DNA recombinase